MNTDGYLIGHHPAGHKDRGLFAHERRVAVLEFIDGGVFAESVVTHRSARHRLTHSRGRSRDRVGAKIDELFHQSQATGRPYTEEDE